MKVGLEAARWLIYRAAASLGASRDASLHAAIAKLFVSEKFVEVARDAVQLMGGYGYMVESEVERVMRDALGSTIYSGDGRASCRERGCQYGEIPVVAVI